MCRAHRSGERQGVRRSGVCRGEPGGQAQARPRRQVHDHRPVAGRRSERARRRPGSGPHIDDEGRGRGRRAAEISAAGQAPPRPTGWSRCSPRLTRLSSGLRLSASGGPASRARLRHCARFALCPSPLPSPSRAARLLVPYFCFLISSSAAAPASPELFPLFPFWRSPPSLLAVWRGVAEAAIFSPPPASGGSRQPPVRCLFLPFLRFSFSFPLFLYSPLSPSLSVSRLGEFRGFGLYLVRIMVFLVALHAIIVGGLQCTSTDISCI